MTPGMGAPVGMENPKLLARNTCVLVLFAGEEVAAVLVVSP
jgi:hypothetical protein